MDTRGTRSTTGLKPNAPEFKPQHHTVNYHEINAKLNNLHINDNDFFTKPSYTYPTTPSYSPASTPSYTPPPATPSPPTVIENPIGDLKELCDFVRTPYQRRFEEEGQAHSKKYKCILNFCGRDFESEWVTSQKEAEKTSALRLLHTLPVRRVDDSHVQQKGNSHDMHFQAVIQAKDLNNNDIEFRSEWMKKKLEARRDVMDKIVRYYFDQTPKQTPVSTPPPPTNKAQPTLGVKTKVGSSGGGGSGGSGDKGNGGPAYGGGRDHYLYSADDTFTKVKDYLTRWQTKYLPHIREIIGIEDLKYDTQLNSLITVAFMHPSFTHSDELRESVKKVLDVKWTSYERLEFYGDAVLGFVASKLLFEESDTDGPHELTIKRQKMVREDACCSCMKKLGLDRFVIHRDILQTPSAKVLCDIYEAIIGALYYRLNDEAYPFITQLIEKNRESTGL